MDIAALSKTQTLTMQLVDGPMRRVVAATQFPFVIGRSAESNLVLSQSYVSRVHAAIRCDGTQFVLEDTSSRHGTFVNGEQVSRRALQPHDTIQFGSRDGPQLRIQPDDKLDSTSHTILAQLQEIGGQQSDLEKLRWFLQAARELNTAGAVDRVLASLLETTLALAKVERGYVFLASAKGELELALGMDAAGMTLKDTSTVSRTVMRQAIEGTDQFIVTDTLTAEGQVPQSIIANSIHTIICIPLRRLRQTSHVEAVEGGTTRQVFGVLYLESHFQPERVSDVDHELMRTIAREAAALVDNAQLAVIENQARKDNEELQIAAKIQQGLMAVQIPAFSFASVQAHSVACSAVGGDFFDVVPGKDVLNVAVVDVSGKGISAAILAATLQGMLYVQLEAGHALDAIASSTNRYLCEKNVGKYATMLLLRLHEDGALEYINCGHIQPRLCSDSGIRRLEMANLPVGLICSAGYSSATTHLKPGWRVILVSDGVTEAENERGESFGEDGLDSAALCSEIESILRHMTEYCGSQPASDDCTIVQVSFSGRAEGSRGSAKAAQSGSS